MQYTQHFQINLIYVLVYSTFRPTKGPKRLAAIWQFTFIFACGDDVG